MADIVFAPICSSCGIPIYMDVDVENLDYMKSFGLTHESKILHQVQISPSVCPNCGAYFDCVIIPTQLPYEFPTDVTRLHVKHESIAINPVKKIKENEEDDNKK